ncbi:Uncharacterised protein [Mycobacteroides abscessus]|nr:Uncharacterised protein [Mycobacteroides abscessus]
MSIVTVTVGIRPTIAAANERMRHVLHRHEVRDVAELRAAAVAAHGQFVDTGGWQPSTIPGAPLRSVEGDRLQAALTRWVAAAVDLAGREGTGALELERAGRTRLVTVVDGSLVVPLALIGTRTRVVTLRAAVHLDIEELPPRIDRLIARATEILAGEVTAR